jgi:hypothetical protein
MLMFNSFCNANAVFVRRLETLPVGNWANENPNTA